jgi:hypothetical protein
MTSLLAMFGQNSPIYVEATCNGTFGTCTVFENNSNLAVQIVSNLDISGVNTSCYIAKNTTLQTGQPSAECKTIHGAGISSLAVDALKNTIKILEWKGVISDVAIKLVGNGDSTLHEITIPNTLINQSEEITFDFSAHRENNNYDQIVIFPGFNLNDRAIDSVCYFDPFFLNGSSLVNCARGIENIKSSIVSTYPNSGEGVIPFSRSKASIDQIITADILGRDLMAENFNSEKTVLNLNKLASSGAYFTKTLDKKELS